MFSCQSFDFTGLTLSYFVRVNSANPNTFLMTFKHNFFRLTHIFMKNTLENKNYEFHRCVIIVMKQYFVFFGKLNFVFGESRGPTFFFMFMVFIRHNDIITHIY